MENTSPHKNQRQSQHHPYLSHNVMSFVPDLSAAFPRTCRSESRHWRSPPTNANTGQYKRPLIPSDSVNLQLSPTGGVSRTFARPNRVNSKRESQEWKWSSSDRILNEKWSKDSHRIPDTMRLISLKLRKQKNTSISANGATEKELSSQTQKSEDIDHPQTQENLSWQQNPRVSVRAEDQWIFPPPAPTQQTVEEEDQQENEEKTSLKRQLSVRVKRMLRPKKHQTIDSTTSIIPAELKHQLRNIYVYWFVFNICCYRIL